MSENVCVVMFLIFKEITVRINHFFRKDPIFRSLLIVAIVLGVFLRTYNFNNRIHIEADNSRDAQVATYAFDHGKLPLIGQFSSAGPFFYGPWWYWFLETVSSIPFGYLTMWYVMTMLSLVFLLLIFYLGNGVGGRYVGLLSVLFAAISPGVVDNSFSVWNPSIVPLLALTILLLLLEFLKTGKNLHIFLLSFLTGLVITIHFQGVLLIPALVIAEILILFSKKLSRIISQSILVGAGFVTPFLPLLYFDYNHFWFDTNNLLIYLTVDQYKIWVPNRWLTYITLYWPNAWAGIIGGNYFIGVIIICLLTVFVLINLKYFLQKKNLFLVITVFAGEIVLYRFYRGERFSYYSFFAYPCVIVLSAWASFEVFSKSKFAGLILTIAIFLSTFKGSLGLLKDSEISFNKIMFSKAELYKSYPNANFDIFSCYLNGNRASHPLALFVYKDGRNSVYGNKIMVCETPGNNVFWAPISKNDSVSLESVTTSNVYHNTVEWWQDKPPVKGEGSIFKFIKANTKNRFLRLLLPV